MHIKYHIEELNKVIKNLAELLGIGIIVFDSEGETLAQYSNPEDYCSILQHISEFRKQCFLSDRSIVEKCKISRKVEVHFCHAGLCDLAMPIVKDNILAAYVVLGRIRLSHSPEKPIYDLSYGCADAVYEAVTKFSDKQLENLTELLPHIMFDSGISFENNMIAEDVAQYIRANPTDDLSVKALCKRYYISKNALYKAFAEEYECTVNEFVVCARIDEAKRLLQNTHYSIAQIADSVGITNYTYFCKLFKKLNGISPSRYRSQFTNG